MLSGIVAQPPPKRTRRLAAQVILRLSLLIHRVPLAQPSEAIADDDAGGGVSNLALVISKLGSEAGRTARIPREEGADSAAVGEAVSDRHRFEIGDQRIGVDSRSRHLQNRSDLLCGLVHVPAAARSAISPLRSFSSTTANRELPRAGPGGALVQRTSATTRRERQFRADDPEHPPASAAAR